jgi:hypothetical protein
MQVGWIVSAIFATVATITSAWLVNEHLEWYTNVCTQSLSLYNCFLLVTLKQQDQDESTTDGEREYSNEKINTTAAGRATRQFTNPKRS